MHSIEKTMGSPQIGRQFFLNAMLLSYLLIHSFKAWRSLSDVGAAKPLKLSISLTRKETIRRKNTHGLPSTMMLPPHHPKGKLTSVAVSHCFIRNPHTKRTLGRSWRAPSICSWKATESDTAHGQSENNCENAIKHIFSTASPRIKS